MNFQIIIMKFFNLLLSSLQETQTRYFFDVVIILLRFSARKVLLAGRWSHLSNRFSTRCLYVVFLFRFSRRPQYVDIKLKLPVLEWNKVSPRASFRIKVISISVGRGKTLKWRNAGMIEVEIESFIYPYGKKSFTIKRAQSIAK